MHVGLQPGELQCVENSVQVLWCGIVQYGAVWGSVVQCGAVCCSESLAGRAALCGEHDRYCVAVCSGVLRCVVVCSSVMQCAAVYCSVVQCGAVWCGAMQFSAGRCNVVQCVENYRVAKTHRIP